MKKAHFILIIGMLVFSLAAQAQDETPSRFSITSFGGLGYGAVENSTQPDYNLNSNYGEVLLNYRLNDKLGLAIGAGLNELSGNGFNESGSFFHERTLIKVPVLLTYSSYFSEKFRMIGSVGFYGQSIIKDNFMFTETSDKNIYSGNSFGGQTSVGFAYDLNKKFSMGAQYNGSSDLTKLKISRPSFTNEQRIDNLNLFGIFFQARF